MADVVTLTGSCSFRLMPDDPLDEAARPGLDVVGLRELGTDEVGITPVYRDIRDVVHGHSPFLS